MTEFVDNLKGELESTFKEEISVYFDINPHDGLTGDSRCGCIPEGETEVPGLYPSYIPYILRPEIICMGT